MIVCDENVYCDKEKSWGKNDNWTQDQKLITVAVFIHHDQYVSQMWIYFFICILSIVYTCILKAL